MKIGPGNSVRYYYRDMLAVCLAALIGLFVFASTAARAADADGFDLELHPGPEVWLEEHWQVKSVMLDPFMEAYRKEIYSVARRTPGYRGYTVWTFLQPDSPEPPVSSLFIPGSNRDAFIQPHPGMRLNGEILTKRVVNIGTLMARTYNVLIIHHVQTWDDGANFHHAMADIYAEEHGGGVFAEHLSETVYPHVSNVWTADFRVVNTGFPSDGYPAPGPAAPDDADGLDLEPHQGPVAIMEEVWDVKPGKLDEFVAVYERDVYSLLRRVPGYRGLTTITRLAPAAGEPVPPVELGGADEFTVPYPGLLMDGQIRTDLSVNAGMLFKQAYNVKVMHYIESWDDLSRWLPEMMRMYGEENDGADLWELLENTLFPLLNNHWDFPYRVIETSYQAKAPPGR